VFSPNSKYVKVSFPFRKEVSLNTSCKQDVQTRLEAQGATLEKEINDHRQAKQDAGQLTGKLETNEKNLGDLEQQHSETLAALKQEREKTEAAEKEAITLRDKLSAVDQKLQESISEGLRLPFPFRCLPMPTLSLVHIASQLKEAKESADQDLTVTLLNFFLFATQKLRRTTYFLLRFLFSLLRT